MLSLLGEVKREKNGILWELFEAIFMKKNYPEIQILCFQRKIFKNYFQFWISFNLSQRSLTKWSRKVDIKSQAKNDIFIEVA